MRVFAACVLLLTVPASARAELLDLSAFGASEMTLSWAEGAHYRDVTTERTGLAAIYVDGLINTFTVAPYMEILEGPTPETLPMFTMSYRPRGVDGTVVYDLLTPFTPLTFTYTGEDRPNGLSHLGLNTSDVGQELHFGNFRDQFNNPASVIRFGFTITALDYTPNANASTADEAVPTPEPATWMLIGLGAAALARRRHQ